MKRLDELWIRPEDPALCTAIPPSLWHGIGEWDPRVMEYHRRYDFGCPIRQATLYVMADASFRLYVNGEYRGIGPLAAGGDIFTDDVLPHCYPCTYELQGLPYLDFSVLVVAAIMKQADFSSRASGLSLLAEVHLDDGTQHTIVTDDSWQVRKHIGYAPSRDYNRPYLYDGTRPLPPFGKTERAHSRWRAARAQIPMPTEEIVLPLSVTHDEENETVVYDYDRIYSAYLDIENTRSTPVTVEVITHEVIGQDVAVGTLTLSPSEKHRALKMYSVGGVRVIGKDAKDVKVTLHYVHHPFGEGGALQTSDEGLNLLYDVCRHTMHICRQSWHLDSPRHQEPLGCTGDYYIETLMCAMADGDMRLSVQDLIRTSELLCKTEGKMFHTSYSLIFINMLEAVYMFTGDASLIQRCMPAIELLLDRFAGYHGEKGLLELAPDYMFLDWQTVDGYSLHHPPMALGQTALCAFYHGALCSSARLCRIIGQKTREEMCKKEASRLKKAMWANLYSERDGAFLSGFAGNNFSKEDRWLPKNPDRTYLTLHANVLCIWGGVAEGEEGRRIFRRVADDTSLPDYQPYFAHFVLESAEMLGLYEEYGVPLWRRFVDMVRACPKGLQEGWLTPPAGYGFDHSHAWGGTPAWQLPVRLLGLRIEEAGMKRISLSPRLYGLSHWHIEIPLPTGRLYVTLKEGEHARISAPEGIEVTLREEDARGWFREN